MVAAVLATAVGPGAVAGWAASPARSGAVPQEMRSRLQAALDAWAADPARHGVSAAVILADGREWIGTAGDAGGNRALAPSHMIWMASITKTMTGAIILQLAAESVLSLEDPVSRWLEPMANVGPEITIRQLLNHTNGLANYTRNPAVGPALDADSLHRFTPAELVAFIGPPSFARGARTEYTNSSFLLLGLIAEKATGRSITELYHERLWKPRGLNAIFLPGYERPAGPVARAWMGPPATAREVDPMDLPGLLSLGYSAFGLFSNAGTIARWGRDLFAGDVLTEAMRREMLQFVPAAGNIPGESGAGLGIRKYDYLGREQWGHSGGCPLGSSLMFYDPTSGATIAVIMNQGAAAQHFVLAGTLLEIVAP